MSASTNRTDRAAALRLAPALTAIVDELAIYETLLRRWQKTINLVAAPTLDHLWTRHFADSAQVVDAVPDVTRWVDLGSGGGFPGLVTALLLKSRGGVVHLVESDQRKAAFLRAVSRETGAPTEIHVGRIDSVLPTLPTSIGGVSARALAPLPQLVDWSCDLLLKNAVGAFLKGEDWRSELTGLQREARFAVTAIPSRTNPAARLVLVRKAEAAGNP